MKLREHQRLAAIVGDSQEAYRYERDLEEFLRRSPSVRPNARQPEPAPTNLAPGQRRGASPARAPPATTTSTQTSSSLCCPHWSPRRWPSSRTTSAPRRAARGHEGDSGLAGVGSAHLVAYFRCMGAHEELHLGRRLLGGARRLGGRAVRLRPRAGERDRPGGQGRRRGGRRPDARRGARAARAQILQPLERPIVVHHAAKTWKLGPREARLRADLGAMVDEALARSRTGNVFSRSWRSLSGKQIDADLQPTVQYSDAAVIRLIDRVRGRSSGRPRTRASRSAPGRRDRPGVEGLAVSASQLHRQIGAAITSTRAPRTFVAQTRHIQPKVTTADLRRKYDTVIIVNRGRSGCRCSSLKPAQTYSIAVGQVGLETPAGQYTIANKAINPAWHVPNSAWAGDLAGKVIPGDDPTTRSRRAGWASSTASASTGPPTTPRSATTPRTAASACTSPTSRSSTTRCPWAHRSTSPRAQPAPGSGRRDLLPAPLEKQGMVVAVSKHQRADEDPLLPPAHDRVPQRRGVGRALDPVPWARRLLVRADGARVDELAMGGDLTRGRVDEEHPHGRGG